MQFTNLNASYFLYSELYKEKLVAVLSQAFSVSDAELIYPDINPIAWIISAAQVTTHFPWLRWDSNPRLPSKLESHDGN